MYIAVEAGNTEIVNLLLSYPNIDPNLRSVFINFFFHQISNNFFKYNLN